MAQAQYLLGRQGVTFPSMNSPIQSDVTLEARMREMVESEVTIRLAKQREEDTLKEAVEKEALTTQPKTRLKRSTPDEVSRLQVKSRLMSDPELKTLIHQAMLRLIGVERTGRKLPPLPGPLSPGEPPRVNAQGDTLFNPDWAKGLTNTKNLEYIKTAVSLVIQNEGVRSIAR